MTQVYHLSRKAVAEISGGEPGQTILSGSYTPYGETASAFRKAVTDFTDTVDLRDHRDKATMNDVITLAHATSVREWQNHVFFKAMKRYAQALEMFLPSEEFLSLIWVSMRAIFQVS
jgi:hypothetical protein